MGTAYIYLHGFASSPLSSKARYLQERFAKLGLELHVLNLNQGNFSELTLTRQIQQTIQAFPTESESVVLIGSSFGALTAAWVAQQQFRVTKLVLLAPAFGFPVSWYDRLSAEQISKWQVTGYLEVYHYGAKQSLPLKYQFLEDAHNYPLDKLERSLETLIIHGVNDQVVPIQVSRDYAQNHDLVKLIELESDHGLNDAQAIIWGEIKTFLQFAELY